MEIINLSATLTNTNIEKAKRLISLFPFSYNEMNCLFYINDLSSFNAPYFNDLLKDEQKQGEFNYCLINNCVEVNIKQLNKKWLNYFQKHDIKLNVLLAVNDNIDILKDYKNINKIIVELKDDNFDVASVNNLYKKYAFSIDITVHGDNNSLLTNNDKYSKVLKEYFPTWIKDKEGVLFHPYLNFIDDSLGGSYKVCTNDSCIGKYFYMDEKGNVYTCSKPCVKKYAFGNIDEITKLDDVYLSKDFARFLNRNIERRKAWSNCSHFKKCQGGCASDSILNNGKIDEICTSYCHNYQDWQAFVKDELAKIRNEKIPLNELNPCFRKILVNSLIVEIRL